MCAYQPLFGDVVKVTDFNSQYCGCIGFVYRVDIASQGSRTGFVDVRVMDLFGQFHDVEFGASQLRLIA